MPVAHRKELLLRTRCEHIKEQAMSARDKAKANSPVEALLAAPDRETSAGAQLAYATAREARDAAVEAAAAAAEAAMEADALFADFDSPPDPVPPPKNNPLHKAAPGVPRPKPNEYNCSLSLIHISEPTRLALI
eukprot:6331824-Alexandrium_andersonii.AAC.1